MTLKVVYECPDGTPFPVEWPDAEMAKDGWRWDQLHNPTPLTPLSQDLNVVKNAGMIRAGLQTGHIFLGERIYASGYGFTRSPETSAEDEKLFTAIAARDATLRIDHLIELWESSYRPECEALTRSFQTWASPADSLAELMDRFDEVEAIYGRLGELHELTMGLTNAAAGRFSRFCREGFGDEEGDRIAEATVAGLPNKSLESADALWELSREARRRPAVAGLLRERASDEFLAELDGAEQGAEFRLLLDRFLDEWGQRNESFVEIAFPTWREDPRFVVSTLASYLDAPGERSPTALNQQVASRREAVTAEAEARLAEPEKVDAFRTAQRRAQQRTVLIEDHNYYIDQIAFSTLRVPCLAIGDRLVRQGSVDRPDDVFYLFRVEIEEAARRPDTRYQSLVSERRRDRETWMGVIPPAVIGEGEIKMGLEQAQRLGFGKRETSEDGEIRGLAASAGTVQGKARVILTLENAERLAPGEILVTYATTPPWTPLFAVAAAVVTDAGGPLSHCAIVAREYGIPAVVGTQVATAQIEDGALITVNGGEGVVTIDR